MPNHPTCINLQKNHDRILRANEVVSLTGLSRSTLWRLESAGSFPVRRQLSPGAVGWFISEVEKWLADRQAVTPINVKPVAPHARHGRKPQIPTANLLVRRRTRRK
jgi:predicted DNA-binding transcriptional regulator AlpA